MNWPSYRLYQIKFNLLVKELSPSGCGQNEIVLPASQERYCAA